MWKEEATSESIDNGRMNSAEKIVLSNPINVRRENYYNNGSGVASSFHINYDAI